MINTTEKKHRFIFEIEQRDFEILKSKAREHRISTSAFIRQAALRRAGAIQK